MIRGYLGTNVLRYLTGLSRAKGVRNAFYG